MSAATKQAAKEPKQEDCPLTRTQRAQIRYLHHSCRLKEPHIAWIMFQSAGKHELKVVRRLLADRYPRDDDEDVHYLEDKFRKQYPAHKEELNLKSSPGFHEVFEGSLSSLSDDEERKQSVVVEENMALKHSSVRDQAFLLITELISRQVSPTGSSPPKKLHVHSPSAMSPRLASPRASSSSSKPTVTTSRQTVSQSPRPVPNPILRRTPPAGQALETPLHHFLSRDVEISLVRHYDLFCLVGLDSINKLRAMASWKRQEMVELVWKLLASWPPVEVAGAAPGLSRLDLMSLERAIEKMDKPAAAQAGPPHSWPPHTVDDFLSQPMPGVSLAHHKDLFAHVGVTSIQHLRCIASGWNEEQLHRLFGPEDRVPMHMNAFDMAVLRLGLRRLLGG
ncbi:hypothetical protein HMN09_00923900 [Mycena chlorophos]|uniref:Uncharacterized protein n=1 Tax=Mycena chlorophos TaxID=658473 RepID=A0A8H6SLC2_MYCCL|nr:hypothetical protein HMN09_00923900 [Mycena chlorophos]